MCHFSWQVRHLVYKVHVSLFVAGAAAFGEVHVSLFVAGAACQFMCHFSWQAQHLVEFSLFVAGAAFNEIWNASRSGKCCNFQ